MPLIPVLILILLAVGGVATAAVALLNDIRRREALRRAGGELGTFDESFRSVLLDARAGLQETPLTRLITTMGGWWKTDAKTEGDLVRAGYDGAMAPVTWGAVRVACLVGLSVLAFVLVPARSANEMLLLVIATCVTGYILPTLYLARTVRFRQERIVRSLPDVMDLLVLCVEAGLGFDAAVLRVAKEMENAHPDISTELLLVNRKVNAGVTREEALRAAYTRTGVEQLRVLVQHMIQSERLGTSVGKVLRVYGQTLRVKRKQNAERKAATAPLKMTIPMAFLILPALFIVILGPAALQMIKLFGGRTIGSGTVGGALVP
jgi:tight adherence protein C